MSNQEQDPDFRLRMHHQGPPGFDACTRPWPHDGPCAHPPDDDDPVREQIRLIRLALHADDAERATIMIDELASTLGIL